ncbi:hypothetical protein DOO74_15505 [Rhodobacteraceae bacterium AsT-22]|nr:hypothetical protein DOO74_15505 [Rhodobacteraceae bacterium AsT-22]
MEGTVVEIFTTSGDETQRVTGSELRLESPADVYFGDATPGIAYYEKSGADLNVTLLDGTTVLIEDFFVIGAEGRYSRLLQGRDGSEEVTGLIAPEPLLASVGDTINRPVDATPLEEPAPRSEPAELPMEEGDAFEVTEVEDGVVQVSWAPSEGGQAADTGYDAAQGGGMGQFVLAGSSVDKLAFGGFAVASTSLLLGEWSAGDGSGTVGSTSGSGVASAAVEEPEPATDEVVAETEEDGTEDVASGVSGEAASADGSAPVIDEDAPAPEIANTDAENENDPGADDYVGNLVSGILGFDDDDMGEGGLFAEVMAESATGVDETIESGGMFGDDEAPVETGEDISGYAVMPAEDDSSLLDAPTGTGADYV